MTTYRMSSSVASEVLDGEAIVIDLVSGDYFSFRGWTTWAWEALQAGMPAGEVDAVFAEVGGSQAFVESLVAAGLLVDRGDEPSAVTPERPAGPVTELEFDRFDDMADMIQIDPVHDVDRESGWPRAADA